MMKHWKNVDIAEWPCQFFTPQELACRGTGMVLLTIDSIAAMRKLDALRRAMGHALICNSGFRTEGWNKKVRGAPQSKHMEGIAFDISMANVDPHRFEAEARKLGFTGIGIYPPQKPTGAKNFIHIDTRKGEWRGAQWGEFPKRATRFAPEPAPTPIRNAARDVGPLAGAGGAMVVLAEELDPAVRELAPWLPDQWQALAFGSLAALGVGLALRRFLTARNKGE
jgi:zinc D-Ala-D-Ala carboxypeptidase